MMIQIWSAKDGNIWTGNSIEELDFFGAYERSEFATLHCSSIRSAKKRCDSTNGPQATLSAAISLSELQMKNYEKADCISLVQSILNNSFATEKCFFQSLHSEGENRHQQFECFIILQL